MTVTYELSRYPVVRTGIFANVYKGWTLSYRKVAAVFEDGLIGSFDSGTSSLPRLNEMGRAVSYASNRARGQ